MATKRIPTLMKDKNGKVIRKGDIVVIENGYFKNSNGRFVVEHAPLDADWCGRDYSLRRLNRDGSRSRAKGSTQFWPIFVTVSSAHLRFEAKEHNAKFATIEVVG